MAAATDAFSRLHGWPSATLPLLMLAPLLLAAGCNRGPAVDPAAQRPSPPAGASSASPFQLSQAGSPPDRRTSHQRMLDELDYIRRSTDATNGWLGSAAARRLRDKAAALPSDAAWTRRADVLFKLAEYELRLGNEEEAIADLEGAEAAVRGAGLPEPSQTEALAPIQFRLGVAHLRRAETTNCCSRHTPESCIVPIQGRGIHTQVEGSTEAIRRFQWVLERTEPRSTPWLRALWLYNIAHMTLGQFPDATPPRWRLPPEAFSSEDSFPAFVNQAASRGVDTFSLAGGAAADDFDNDGDVDLMVSSMDPKEPGQLRWFVNQGDGRFQEQTEAAGLLGLLGGLNLVHADFNNDGWLDVLVLRGGWLQGDGRHPNSLLRNNGDGTFTDVTYDAGIDRPLPTQTADWADYDRDGDLDLYVGNEHSATLTAPCQLFRNNGDGTFTDVASAAGVANRRFTKAVVWGDYDGDQWPDLYVSNFGEPNRLFRNRGDGSFEDVAPRLQLEQPRRSFPAWFWDYDNDGRLDLYVAGYADDIAYLSAELLELEHAGESSRLYHNNGKGGFEERARQAGIGGPVAPMGSNFGDLDNDGWLDFYLGTGEPRYRNLMPNRMYRNVEGNEFANVTMAGRFGHLQKGHAVVFADFDQDGDQDVFEQIGGAFPGDRYYDGLFENPGFNGEFLQLRLIGVDSSRSALGARVEITCESADGSRRTLYRFVDTGGSFGSNPLSIWCGLGDARRIHQIHVTWPSGATQAVPPPALNQRIIVLENDNDA